MDVLPSLPRDATTDPRHVARKPPTPPLDDEVAWFLSSRCSRFFYQDCWKEYVSG